jgi:hypothetical protein
LSEKIKFLVAAVAITAVVLGIRYVPQRLSDRQLRSWSNTHFPRQPTVQIYDWSGVCPVRKRSIDPPVKTTLCEAARNPWRFACRQITFHATVNADCFEHSALVDEGCVASPIGRAEPDTPATVDFFHGLCGGRMMVLRSRSATFTGTFLWWHTLTEDRFAVELADVTDTSPVRMLR